MNMWSPDAAVEENWTGESISLYLLEYIGELKQTGIPIFNECRISSHCGSGSLDVSNKREKKTDSVSVTGFPFIDSMYPPPHHHHPLTTM